MVEDNFGPGAVLAPKLVGLRPTTLAIKVRLLGLWTKEPGSPRKSRYPIVMGVCLYSMRHVRPGVGSAFTSELVGRIIGIIMGATK
jgi:hypothetical protein